MKNGILYSLIGLLALSIASAQSTAFTDNFSSYAKNSCFADVTSFGPWTNVFSGYGCIQVGSSGTQSWLDEAPTASLSTSETHASLATGPSFSLPLTYTVSVKTVAQLRQGSAPNPWEVGWVLWNYSDNSHFYYFIPKPTGWELGKEDPAFPGAQRFLASGTSPTFPIGSWHNIQITQNAQNTMTVSANGQAITTFTDTQTPYTSGKIALYNEDSHVQFTNIAVNTSATTITTASNNSTGATPTGGGSTSTAAWQNVTFVNQTGTFEAKFDATPNTADMDGVVGLSNGSASDFTNLAAIVRFNNSGSIDARNGGAYAAASSIPYTPGTIYHFRLDVNVANHTYSAYVTPNGGSEVLIGSNYSFRVEQATVAQLNNRGVFADSGTETGGPTISVAATSGSTTPTNPTASATPTWQNVSFSNQTGSFEAKFDATPNTADMDGVVGLSNGSASAFTGLAAIVRFNNTGAIDARNGGAYAATSSIPYTPGKVYHFRLDVNVANHTYSAYVTPNGGSEVLIGQNYAFRAEVAGVTQLNNMGSYADSGTETAGSAIGIAALVASSPSGSSTSTTLPATVVPINVWKNSVFSSQTGAFEARFDATPNVAKMDGLLGLSNGPASAFTSMAAVVRFNNMGAIDARNGGAYAAARAIAYTPGTVYHFRVDVNLAKHTYSAYVTPNGGTEVLIGLNYTFRSEQASVLQLNNFAAFADSGTESPGAIAIAPWVPTAAAHSSSIDGDA